ncbi:MAG: peroxiredoxin-like family protein [Gammaproteobacteria bacterium]|nr:peroxiredoxin-like family protein [Gammaproteobacteria bacterium]
MTDLTEQLKTQRQQSESRREKRQVDVMHRATSDLLKKGVEKTALQTGDVISRFQLENTHGALFDIFDALKAGPVILSFYRGSWCPYCNLTLRAYQAHLAEIHACGARFVAVSPELRERALANARKFGLAFEILSDAGNAVAKQFGLAYKMPAELAAVYLELGTDIPRFNGDDSWELPVPATYIIDTGVKIVFSSINADYLQRIEPGRVIRALKALQESPA